MAGKRGTRKEDKKKLNKLQLKVLSVFLSFFLWVYVLSSANVEMIKTIPINIIPPAGLQISNNYSKEVTFQLKGPRAFLRELIERQETFTIDLNKKKAYKKNFYKVHFNRGDIKLPFGVSVESVSPEVQSIYLEKKKSKRFQIIPQFNGTLSKELKMISSKITPSKIFVQGPKSLINDLKHIKSQSIDLSTFKKDGELEVALDIDDRLTWANEEKVVFSYKVRARKANKKINNVPIRFLSSNQNFKGSVTSVSMTVLTEKENSEIKPGNIQVIADIPDNAKGKIEVPLKAVLPKDIILLEIEPKTIFIYVK
jgi:YbbR domain-containing protein